MAACLTHANRTGSGVFSGRLGSNVKEPAIRKGTAAGNGY